MLIQPYGTPEIQRLRSAHVLLGWAEKAPGPSVICKELSLPFAHLPFFLFPPPLYPGHLHSFFAQPFLLCSLSLAATENFFLRIFWSAYCTCIAQVLPPDEVRLELKKGFSRFHDIRYPADSHT